MRVWKYMSAKTAQRVLEMRSLRFSPLTERDNKGNILPVLNDRADCALDLSGEVALVMQDYRDRGKSLVDRLPPGQRDPDDTIEKTIERAIRQQIRENGFRILSLSEVDPVTPESNLLWGHYGDSSTGVALEFDFVALSAALDADLIQGRQRGFNTPCRLGQIIYDDRIPKYPERWLSHEDSEKRVLEAIFRKDTGWRYEREHRIVILIDKGALSRSILALPFFTWKFPVGVLTKIYLSEYCTNDTAEMVNKLADGVPVRRHY
jgi:hypothetical protein